MNDERTLEVSSKERASDWAIKDVLIAIPFFASGLALTWEVGFQVIKGGSFGIFTIAEHITFALQALPIAVFLSTAIVGGVVEHHLLDRYTVPRLEHMSHKERRRIAIQGLAIGLILNILLGVCVYFYMRSASLMLLLAIVCGFIIILMPAPELVKDETVLVIVGLTVGFGMAFGLGIDLARNELSSELPLNKITIGEKGKDAEMDVTAQIIRSGERGVLYYDPKLYQFGLVPWDSIKRIDWARSPLMAKPCSSFSLWTTPATKVPRNSQIAPCLEIRSCQNPPVFDGVFCMRPIALGFAGFLFS